MWEGRLREGGWWKTDEGGKEDRRLRKGGLEVGIIPVLQRIREGIPSSVSEGRDQRGS